MLALCNYGQRFFIYWVMKRKPGWLQSSQTACTTKFSVVICRKRARAEVRSQRRRPESSWFENDSPIQSQLQCGLSLSNMQDSRRRLWQTHFLRRGKEGRRSSFMNLEMNVTVNWAQREMRHRSGCRRKLSAREAELLAFLARKPGTPVSRDEILAQVWQLDPGRTATRTIDMHISFLRRKLDEDAEGASVLITVHRVGYMLHPGAISCDDVSPAAGAAGRLRWELLTALKPLSVA